MTAHFYWIGAVPPMPFIGVFMMPFYYASRARSVPEYLKMRFNEKARRLGSVARIGAFRHSQQAPRLIREHAKHLRHQRNHRVPTRLPL